MTGSKRLLLIVLNYLLMPQSVLADSKPFRTFVTVKGYHQESNGHLKKPESLVRLEVQLPNGQTVGLPENNQFWTVSNQQSQEVEQTFEVPYEWVHGDGFTFQIKMIQSGKDILPCQFQVSRLSEYNRTYFCRTDVNFQTNQLRVPEQKLVKQAVEVRVFSDLNSSPKEIPKKFLAYAKSQELK
ncbi:hypothetical protein EBQ90_00645 [bacterium]|nr:hypothetical protein [bacterium]